MDGELAVVAGEEHRGLLAQAHLVEDGEHPTELLVDQGDVSRYTAISLRLTSIGIVSNVQCAL